MKPDKLPADQTLQNHIFARHDATLFPNTKDVNKRRKILTMLALAVFGAIIFFHYYSVDYKPSYEETYLISNSPNGFCAVFRTVAQSVFQSQSWANRIARRFAELHSFAARILRTVENDRVTRQR